MSHYHRFNSSHHHQCLHCHLHFLHPVQSVQWRMRIWCFKVECSKCQRSKRAGGLPLGKASGKAGPAPTWSFFHRSVISFRKYSGRPHNRERGGPTGVKYSVDYISLKTAGPLLLNQVYNFEFFIVNLSLGGGIEIWSRNFAVSGSAKDPF